MGTDWTFHCFGLTADELVAASRGGARKLTGKEQIDHSGTGFTTLAVGEFCSGAFEFDLSFRAEPNGRTVKTVRLELREPEQYHDLWNALSARFGDGEVLPPDSDGAIQSVRWRTAREMITLRRLTWPMDLGVDVVVDCERDEERLEERRAS